MSLTKTKIRKRMNQLLDATDFHPIVLNTVMLGSAAVFSQLLQYSGLFIVLTAALSVDLILGLMASYRVNETITSRKFKLGIMSKVSVLLLVALIAMVLHSFYPDKAATLVTWFLWVFTISELVSSISNWETLKTGVRKKEQDIMVLILGKFRSKIKKIFGMGEEK